MQNYNKMDMIKDMVELAFQISVAFIPNTKEAISEYNDMSGKPFKDKFETSPFQEDMLKLFEKGKIYCVTNRLLVNYTITCFSNDKEEYLMIVGPCLFQEITDEFYSNIIRKNHLHHSTKIYLQNYYNIIPIMNKTRLNFMTGIADRYLYNEQLKFKFITLTDETHDDIDDLFSSESSINILQYQFLEQQHSLEEQPLLEVSYGNKKEAHEIYDKLYFILKNIYNLKEPLNNAKSYSYAMNTLLRKTAEKSGVHIVLTNYVSIKHINRIDQSMSLSEIHNSNSAMLIEYCTMVQEASLHKYSKNVGTVVNHINLYLSTDMTLSSLSKLVAITSNHLASSFKKEVCLSVMEYVTKKRMELAKEMLERTNLQTQEIANYIGYNDVSYFSRVFKKQIGLTPTGYRNHMKLL